MRRRALIALLGGAGAWPFAVPAQEGSKLYRLGLLTPTDGAGRLKALSEALQKRGYQDGQNVIIDLRSAEGRLDQLPDLAHDLVRTGVQVIVALNTPGAQTVLATGTTIPIVMALIGDPVGSGFVKNLNHPGGTVTGVSNASGEIAAKRLALLKEALPHAKRIAVFTHPDNPVGAIQIRQVEASADVLGIEVKVFPVHEAHDDIRRAVGAALAWRADAVFRILAQAGMGLSRFQAELMLEHRLPAMLATRADVENGALMSYYADLSEHWSQVADYVDRILKGSAPGDLPVALPTKFEFVLNLKTARELGLTIPPTLLARADEVIE